MGLKPAESLQARDELSHKMDELKGIVASNQNRIDDWRREVDDLKKAAQKAAQQLVDLMHILLTARL